MTRNLFIILLTAVALGTVACDVPPNNVSHPLGQKPSMQMEDPFDPDRPPTAKTLYIMADILSAQGKEAEAEQMYRRIHNEYPEFTPMYNDYAALLMRQRRIPEATKVLEAGLDQNPNDAVLLNNMGMCCLIRKDYPRALSYFTDAAAVIPENTRYRSNMATVLALMGRSDEALSLYKQILPEKLAKENVQILQENLDKIR